MLLASMAGSIGMVCAFGPVAELSQASRSAAAVGGESRCWRSHACKISPHMGDAAQPLLQTTWGGKELLRDGRVCLLVTAASGRPSSDRRKGPR
jgi:hypothetical protein